MQNLLDIIPNVDTSNASGYCSVAYYVWEEKIATPALVALGYTDIYFSMGERDSFGPLTRIVTVKDATGARHQFIYG